MVIIINHLNRYLSSSATWQPIIVFLVCLFQYSQKESVQTTAQKIAQEAKKLSQDQEYVSPFAKAAASNGYRVSGMCTVTAQRSIIAHFISFSVMADLLHFSTL